ASKLIHDAQREPIARGEGFVLTFGEHANAVLHNALGHYATAFENAQRASAQDELHASVWSLPELVEAAVRSGKPELAADALERLRPRTQAAGTGGGVGAEAGRRDGVGARHRGALRSAVERRRDRRGPLPRGDRPAGPLSRRPGPRSR